MDTLTIEIGCEEIPAGYIVPALEAFRDKLIEDLDRQRIAHGTARILGTPRRLVLMVNDVAETQAAQTSTLTGPPEKVGYDDKAKPTLAAEKFAQKAGIPVEQLIVKDTGKGRYLTAVVEEACESSVAIIEQILPKHILAMPFPKSMRWGSLSISFARPILSLTGLLGKTVLSFCVGNIQSGNLVFGHQFMNPGPHAVLSADDYEQVLESVGVVPDFDKRRAILVQGIEKLAADNNCSLMHDPELVDIVTNLVEFPYPVVGRFDEDFLAVPDEVLITAMREHQKYFALADENGGLRPMFIAVNNTQAKDMNLVARGHEKVLRARLSDAKFFFETDLESSLDAFADKLKNVTFQAKLGTVHEKCRRINALVKYLAEVAGYDDVDGLKTKLTRAAAICKADLVSQVVIEFTKLQGMIGRAYALKAGEDKDVALAIEQHYRPVQSGGRLPENPTAVLLAIADKMDTIAGCFCVNLIPTGGADPYALRRQGIGILLIMMAENLEFSLADCIDKSLTPYMPDTEARAATAAQVHGFVKNRMVNILTDQGFSKEAVTSALAAAFDNVPDVKNRVAALDSLRQEPDFEPLAVTFKRVENILKKAEGGFGVEADTALFQEEAETLLYNAVSDVAGKTSQYIDSGDYAKALKTISTLRPDVDRFFEDVMVFDKDADLQKNRIALLSQVSDLFARIADFSKL